MGNKGFATKIPSLVSLNPEVFLKDHQKLRVELLVIVYHVMDDLQREESDLFHFPSGVIKPFIYHCSENLDEFFQLPFMYIQFFTERLHLSFDSKLFFHLPQGGLLVCLPGHHMTARRANPMIRSEIHFLAPELEQHVTSGVKDQNVNNPVGKVLLIYLLARSVTDHLIVVVDYVKNFHENELEGGFLFNNYYILFLWNPI